MIKRTHPIKCMHSLECNCWEDEKGDMICTKQQAVKYTEQTIDQLLNALTMADWFKVINEIRNLKKLKKVIKTMGA